MNHPTRTMGDQAAPNADRERKVTPAPDSPDLSTAVPDGVSAQEAARLLGLHERTVRRAIQRGALIATKKGRSFQIVLEALERYRRELARHTRRDQVRPRLYLLPTPFTRFV
ncbi:MAG TPA: helix-turn-helix domain-containing protein, partial [Thermomicrobiales bacterium]|nr:helix-turn-helix domain-containing protein [Thermomicrobiales bacterium]